MAGQNEEESDDDSNYERKSRGTKSTASSVSSSDLTCYSIARLGKKIYQESPGFDLSDPNMHLVDSTYNCLHDVHLRQYFRQPEKKRKLIQNGLITTDEKVLYTRKEYTRYSRYSASVQLSWDKAYYEKQKKLMKDFMILKEKGTIPPHIHISDMRDWLVHKGTHMHRNVSQWQSGNKGAMRRAQLTWEVNRRLKLESIEKEVCREIRTERKKRPLSKRTEWMKKSVECISHPGSSGAGPKCFPSPASGMSEELVFTSSTSIGIFPSSESQASDSASDRTFTPQSPASDLLSDDEDGRFTSLLPENEKVIYVSIKSQVITELRKNFIPVINEKNNRWPSSGSSRRSRSCSRLSHKRFYPPTPGPGSHSKMMVRSKSAASSGSSRPTSSCSQQSHRSSNPPTPGPSSRTTIMVRPKSSASMLSDGAISPATQLVPFYRTTESFLGATFYTEVPISEMLCDGNHSSPPGSNNAAASTVDKSESGTDSTSSEEADDRCVSIRPVATTDKEGVKLLGGMTTDDIDDVDLDLEVDLYTQDIIKTAAQHTSIHNMGRVYATRGPSPKKQNSQKEAKNIATILYHNIKNEAETSRNSTPYSSNQVTFSRSWCEMTGDNPLKEFADPLSPSAMDLLKGTFGEQALKSLKTTNNKFRQITIPTSEKLFFMSHPNNTDTIVHHIAIEELSTMNVVETASLRLPVLKKDNSKRAKTPASRPNTCASGKQSRRPSPTRQLLQAVVEKLVTKMTVRCMSIPEESNETACKQLEEPCHSPEGPLSEFHCRVASRLCPALVTDIMESLSNEIVSPHDGESTTQTPVDFTEDDSVKFENPHHCIEEDGCNTDSVELSCDSADILKMAVTDIEAGMTDSGKQSSSHLPAKTEVVVDIITKLVSDIESDSPTSSLTDVAVDMVVDVLDNLSEVSSAASLNNLELDYTRPATAKIVGNVRKALEEQVGSTDALKQALNSGSEDVTKAISSAVSREVSDLLSKSVARHLASTSSSVSLPSSLDVTSSPTVRPLTAAVSPTFHPNCGHNPNHRSSSAMDRQPVVMVVLFDSVRDIVGRLLIQLLPKGLDGLNLADCNLFDVIFQEFSSNLFVRLTGNKQKATVCLDSVEVTQVVLSVYTEIIKLYGSPEDLQAKVFANCPQLYGQISKLIVKAILKSPTRKPAAVEAKPSSDVPSQGTSHPPTSKRSLSVSSVEDILTLVLTKMETAHLDKTGQLPRIMVGYLTITIMDMTLAQLKALPGFVLVDTEKNINDFLKDKMASNIHSALSGKGITAESVYRAVQKGNSSVQCIIRDELINEIRARCLPDDCPDVVKPQRDQPKIQQTTVSSITQDEVRQVAAYSTVDNSLRSIPDKEKTPKRKSRASRLILRIFKGVRHSFASCIRPSQVKD